MTHDDPRLTAYALNELDEADRAAVEALLARDESARQFVEETRRTAALLARGMQLVQTPALTAQQKQAITAATEKTPTLSYAAVRRRPAVWAKWAIATAACAALVAGGIAMLHQNASVYVGWTNISWKPTDAERSATIATLVERSQEQIRKRNYKSALAIMTQILELDASNDYARGAYPVVEDRAREQGDVIAPRSREVTNALNAPATRPATYEDVLRYPENWPDVSESRTKKLWSLATNPGPTASQTVPAQSGQSLSFTQSPSTGVPGSIGSTGAGSSVEFRFTDTSRSSRISAGSGPTWGGDSVLIPKSDEWNGPAQPSDGQPHPANPANESYAPIADNPFLTVSQSPLSTFSIDVDTGSYSNIRRFIEGGRLPPPDAVRIEEMLNYFPYDYRTPKPDSKEPFAAAVEIAGCPWNSAHRLARVAIKGREIDRAKRPVSNLVFLIDVSGSMNEPAKLPLVKEGLKLMVGELTENDRISIVVYAGNAGLVLPSTTADPRNKQTILDAINNLSAGGSTNGGQGIELAYRIASDNFIKGGTNRVLLATDGDWNVGITDQSSLTQLIQDKAKSGVFLSVLGYGFGNLKDSTMEKLADKGNGHYAYIDSLKESKKVLIEEMSSTLITIAKDVKIQVEFNPAKVESYRLLGYEKRLLRKEDFNNDKVDAGEIGAGHCVTALYEIVPGSKGVAAAAPPEKEVDPLKYQKHALVQSDELLTLKLRYKQPDADISSKIEIPAVDRGITYAKASDDFKFSAAIAQFGMILRDSADKGSASLAGVLELADEGKGKDEKGYRGEFLQLVKKTQSLMKK